MSTKVCNCTRAVCNYRSQLDSLSSDINDNSDRCDSSDKSDSRQGQTCLLDFGAVCNSKRYYLRLGGQGIFFLKVNFLDYNAQQHQKNQRYCIVFILCSPQTAGCSGSVALRVSASLRVPPAMSTLTAARMVAYSSTAGTHDRVLWLDTGCVIQAPG